MSLGNRCGFYSRRDVYCISDLSCKGSIVGGGPFEVNCVSVNPFVDYAFPPTFTAV